MTKTNFILTLIVLCSVGCGVLAFYFETQRTTPLSKEAAEIIAMLEDDDLEWYTQSLGMRNLVKLGKIEIDISNEKVTVSGYEIPLERSSDRKQIIEAAKRRERSLVMGHFRKEKKEVQEAAVKKMKEELETIKNRAKLERDLDAARQRDEERKKRVSNEPIRWDAGEQLATLSAFPRTEPPALRMPMAVDHDAEEVKSCTLRNGNPVVIPVRYDPMYYSMYTPVQYPNGSLFPMRQRSLGIFTTTPPTIGGTLRNSILGVR